MEEENNVIYSYVQAGDQNDGVVMSTGKMAKISMKFGYLFKVSFSNI